MNKEVVYRLQLILLPWILLTVQAASTSGGRSTYIIHMDKSVMPRVFTTHQHWYSSILDSLKTATDRTASDGALHPQLVYTYDHALHGFSALLSPPELESLRELPGFVSAYIDRAVTMDTTHTFEFLKLNSHTGLWPASDYGEDVIVGVIDSGVWPESPSFKDNGMSEIPARWKGSCEEGEDFNSSMCNRKLIGARSFTKGLTAANLGVKDSPRDGFGHGTHTSSTVAGNYVKGATYFGYATGTARGVAPRARVAMYKVFGGQGLSSDVIAGIDQAIADGVDVISISMGFDFVPLYEDPIAIASFAAMEKGVMVSCSAGNEGPLPLGTLHNGIPWIMTVAASTIDRSFAGTLTLGNGVTITGWTMFPASALVQDLPLVYNETLSACNSTELLSAVPYGIVVCYDTGYMYDQLSVISEAEVHGAIFISDDTELFELGDVNWPITVISSKDAPTVIDYAKTGNKPTATMTFQQTIVDTKPAPAVAFYTSRGPSPSCPTTLKPDVMAPGSLVLAAWIPIGETARIGNHMPLSSDYTMISGTSMACPHASGVAALLRGAHPEWSVAAIRSAIVTTANPYDNTLNHIRDNGLNFTIATPLAMGAGQIDPNSALDPGLIYDAAPQDYVNLLCSMNFTKKQILAITRSNTYICQKASQDLNYPSFIVIYNQNDTSSTTLVQKFQRTVTNVGDGAATYHAIVIAPRGSKVTVSPTTLLFEKKYEKQSYIMSIKYKSDKDMQVSFGSLIWTEDNGKHRVRSPIAVSPTVSHW